MMLFAKIPHITIYSVHIIMSTYRFLGFPTSALSLRMLLHVLVIKTFKVDKSGIANVTSFDYTTDNDNKSDILDGGFSQFYTDINSFLLIRNLQYDPNSSVKKTNIKELA